MSKNELQKVKEPMYQMISAKASKLELIERFGHLNLKTIVHEGFPSIAALKRIHGDKQITAAMCVILQDLNTSFSEDLSKAEIMEIAYEIKSSINKNITLEGLYMVCSEIKRGSSYKLKVATVLRAVNQHLNEHINAFQSKNYNDHLSRKESKENEYDYAQKLKIYHKVKVEQLKKKHK